MSTLLLIAITIVFIAWKLTRKRGAPHPPGPKPKPLIGNILDLPLNDSHHEYLKWGKRYDSDLLYASALGNHILVLNKREDAEELMERRSAIYSSRPVIPIVKFMGLGWNMALFVYGNEWRMHRRMCQKIFHPDAVQNYYPTMFKNVRKLLQNLLRSPSDFEGHNKLFSVSFSMGTMYGYEVESIEDPCIAAAERTNTLATKLLLPGASLINVIPILGYIPPWFPGASSRKLAAKVQESSGEMERLPMEFVKQSIEDGTVTPSLVSDFLEKKHTVGASKEEEQAIINIAMTVCASVSETTTSTTLTFLYTMAANPEVQRKAQDEIDRVVGSKRLPDFTDRESLPYVEAIYREVLRFRPSFPLGIPHTLSEDDFYKGYFIPKGTTVLSNIWAMTRDEDVYQEPAKFNPERFFDENGKLNDDDRVLVFGFGMRVCVGRHVASSLTWLFMVSVLATFNLGKAKDEFGNDIDINDEFENFGATDHKKSFQCSIVPRSATARRLVDNTTLANSF